MTDNTNERNPSIHVNRQDGYSPFVSMTANVNFDEPETYLAARECLIANLAFKLASCEDKSIRFEFKESSGNFGVKRVSLNVWLKDN